jgi:riboflavin kinase/FMN adenylyltransferase
MDPIQRHVFRPSSGGRSAAAGPAGAAGATAPGGAAEAAGAPLAVVTVGNFDGVHLGHQALIRRVVEEARVLGTASALITFHPHPQSVLRAHQVPILTSLRLRLRLFEQLGLDQACVIPFTREFAQIEPERFVRDYLLRPFQLKKLVIGYDFAFGRNREGTAEFLLQTAHERGFGFEVFPAVTLGDGTVSSTRIRGFLQAGEFGSAARLLGRRYSLLEPVVEGRKQGRLLGFPTLNQVPDEPIPLPFGVYAVHARIGETTFGGVSNYGIRPTVGGTTQPVLETHVFDFAGDLYGQLVEVFPLKCLREEHRFPSLDALKAQIAKDRDAARAFLATVAT